MAKGGFTYPYCAWWLRSPGLVGNAADVFIDGSISYYGLGADRNIGVRPALWINIG